MTRSARALRSTLVVSGFGYVAQALSLVAIPLYLTTIGAENYGLMVTVMALMGYLGFADAGLSWGAMILIAQAHGKNDRAAIAQIVRHGAVLAAGSGALVVLAAGGLLLAASGGWRLPMFSDHPESDRLLLIAGLQLGLNLQFGIVYNLFQGLQESHWTGLYQGGARVLGLAFGMVAAWLTRQVETIMMVQLVLTLVSGSLATVHAFRRHRWAFAAGSWSEPTPYRDLLRIGGKNFLLQIGRTLAGTAPTMGISAIAGPALVPFYTVPTTLLGMVFAPINTWSANLQSAYGEAWAAGDRAWVRHAFRGTLERIFGLGALGVAGFLVLGDPFIRLWTKGQLSLGAPMAWSVAAIALTGALVIAAQYLLTGLDRNRRAAAAEMANGGLALAFVPLAVGQLGAGAVGLGMVLAAAASSLWILRGEIARHLGPEALPSAKWPFKAGFAAAFAVAVAWGLRHLMGPEAAGSLPGIAGAGVALTAAYGIAAVGVGLIPGSALAAASRRLGGVWRATRSGWLRSAPLR